MTDASNLPTPVHGVARRQVQVVVVVEVPRDIRELSSSEQPAVARLCATLDGRRQSAVLALVVQGVLQVVEISRPTLRPGDCISDKYEKNQ